jgi:Tol biopolymer transport system component/DNA-binding winged helix-turn-helix (wHTH) protein
LTNEPDLGESPISWRGQRAVFLSYASEDAKAAGRIAESLRAAGIEVWLDQSELNSGDAWDQKIRREIRTCALFVPVISRNTQARTEGYFRLEWHLADQRTHLMARSRPFLLPVCIDDTPELHAEVPESFAAVQWARLPAGQSSPAFVERVASLLSPEERPATPQLIAASASSGASTAPPIAYQVDDLLIDLGQWRVTRAGRDIPLPHLSFELLVALARSAPNLVTLDQLAERVWPGLTVTPETVSHRVKLVRDALGDDSRAPRYVAGVRGRGYRMVAPVQPLADSRSAAQPEERQERSQASPETLSQPSGTEPVKAPTVTVPVDAVATVPGTGESGEHALGARTSRVLLRRRTWLLLAVLSLSILATLTWLGTRKAGSAGNPLANAAFSRLAGFEGVGRAAAISRDGKFVAFLANREGRNDVWVSEVGSGTYRNLTRGEQREFTSPREIRTLGFSPDSSLVSIWTRSSDGSRPEDVNILAVPTRGGPLRTYLPEVAEYDWSRDGRKLVFHTTAPGDPIYVREPGSPDRRIYVAPAGVHCHFPLWSPDDAFIYFARGTPSAGVWDIWRVRPSGMGLERLTTHNSYVAYPTLLDQRTMVYLATSGDGSGPWLYTLDTERRIPDRISFGLETYTSLGASADGKRLVATVVYPGSSLYRLTLRAKAGAPATALTPALISADGADPRLGRDYVLYVAWRDGKQGIFTLRQGATSEIWSSTHSLIAGVPAISPDGRHIAFITRDNDRTLLYVIDRDGSHARVISDSLALRGNPAWAPDGQSILTAVVRDEEPHLTSIFLNGAPPQPLVAEYSLDPVWSPDGNFLVYSGADIGTTFPLRAAARDGRPYPLPTLILTRGARRVAFSPDGQSLVVLRGDFDHKNFWLIDLRTGAEHILAELPAEFVIRNFDISPDGSEILFDRVQENSELALIERAH